MYLLKSKFSFLVFAILQCLIFIVPSNIHAQTPRPTKYYVVDRVRSNADFATLASWGINTAIVDFKTDGTTASWDSVVNAAAAANINLVIWPDAHQGSDVQGCRWETPFDNADSNNGTDYLLKIRPILDHLGNNPHVIGIVTAHEPVWVNTGDQARCAATVSAMTAIKTQIHNYIDTTVHRNAGYAPFKIWNYIDNIYNMSNLTDYSSTNKRAQISGIMDVAVIWQHCAGYPTYQGDGSACEGTSQYTALGGINYDRNLINSSNLDGTVEEVYIIQTFTAGGAYAGKYTLNQLETYSCDFLHSGSLDGFGYYTWDEGFYTGNLKKFTDLQPAVPNVNTNCVVKTGTINPTVTTYIMPTISTLPTSTTGTKLNLTVLLHGIGKSGDNVNPQTTGNMNPLHLQRMLNVDLTDANNHTTMKQGIVTFNTTTGTFQGSINFGTIASGAYTVRLSAQQYLGKIISGIVVLTNGQTATVPPQNLTTGDVNGDNKLNILDYNMILDCFADLGAPRNCADANKKQMSDLTDDGSVNQFDYNLFLRELSVQAGQ